MTTDKKIQHTSISIYDLTVAQTEEIEMEVGLPVQRWQSAPSLAHLLSAVLAAVEGNERELYSSMTLRELMDRVNLTGEDDPEA
jgi:hypothetical protein